MENKISLGDGIFVGINASSWIQFRDEEAENPEDIVLLTLDEKQTKLLKEWLIEKVE